MNKLIDIKYNLHIFYVNGTQDYLENIDYKVKNNEILICFKSIKKTLHIQLRNVLKYYVSKSKK